MITTTTINVATVTSTSPAAATATSTLSTSPSRRRMIFQMWSLCVVLLLCVVPFISAANEARLTSAQVKLSRSPNAKCSDGTPAAYYWKQATGPKDGIDHSNMWIIGLDDGHPIESLDPPYPWIPACVTTETCKWRQDYYKPYVTTVATGVEREIGGIFSIDSATNAPFTRANLGLIHYCSNDLWMGMNGDVTVNGKSFLFRGQAIIDGVLDDITNRYPAILSKSAQIIFFGTGFGGLGLSTHIDHMCSKFPQSVRCVGVIDGGIYVQPDRLGPKASGIVEFMKLGWPVWQPSLTDTQCVISNPSYPTSPHTCALPPTSLQYHTAPLFVLQSLSDYAAVLLMGYSSSSDNAVLTEMAILTYQSLCGVTAAAGYYAPSCSVHSYLFSSAFTTAFFTTTPMQSLDTWFRAVGRPVLTNGPYGCNSRCQSLPNTFPNATRCNAMAPIRCTSTPPPTPTSSPTDIPSFNNIVAVAIANIYPSIQTPTSQVYGTALFEQDGTSRLTRVTLRIMNLPAKPGGYGVHIHTYGDVENLGVHYNPTNKTHGCGMYASRHIGDVGTILNSTAMSTPPPEEMLYSELVDLGTFTNMSIIGRSIVIHAISDPCFSGGPTGPYMAQGIIGIGNSGTDTNVAKQNPFPSTITAFARMLNSSGLVTGGLRFSQPNAGRIRINGTISGFTPNSQHGIHIRTYGDVSSNIAGGGIFNPMGKPHGLPANGVNRPAGSLGNVQAGSDGVIRIDTEVGTELVTLHTQSVGILGRVIAIDSTPDTGSAMNLMIPVSWGVIGLSSTMLVDPNAPTTVTPTTATPTTATPTTVTPTTAAPTTVTPTTAPTTSTTTNAPTATPTPSATGSSIPVTPGSSTGSASSTSTSTSTESSTGTGIGVIPSLPPSSTADSSNPSINRTLGIKHIIYLGNASHISISVWVVSLVVFLVTLVNLW